MTSWRHEFCGFGHLNSIRAEKILIHAVRAALLGRSCRQNEPNWEFVRQEVNGFAVCFRHQQIPRDAVELLVMTGLADG